jgi:hypothetical protein
MFDSGQSVLAALSIAFLNVLIPDDEFLSINALQTEAKIITAQAVYNIFFYFVIHRISRRPSYDTMSAT